MARRCIDTHVHQYDLSEFDYTAWPAVDSLIRKNYSFEDYINDTNRLKKTNDVDVVGFVYVQVINNQNETEKIIRLSHKYSRLKGIVGWVNLKDPNIDENLERLIREANGKLIGVRHVPDYGNESADWMLNADVKRGLRSVHENGLKFDLLTRPKNLKYLPCILDEFSNMKFVIDHISKPRMDKDNLDSEWFDGIEKVAQYKNVYCKLSGLINEVTSTTELPIETKFGVIEQYIKHILKCFGLNRCMYGTDWPVYEEVGAVFKDVFGFVDKIVLDHAKETYATEDKVQNAWNAVFYQNAVDFYGLI